MIKIEERMKRIVLLCLLVMSVLPLKAQDMAAVFIAMPDEYVPQLEDAWRKDLVDLYRSNGKAQLKNNMNGYSSLEKLTDNYLLLQSTERTTVEMKLLPLVNNTFVICQVVTVKGSVADSRVSFFSPDWKPLDATDMLTPVAADWFIREDADKSSVTYIESTSRLDMDLFRFQLSPDDYTLTQVYTTPEYLDKETQKKLKPFLKDAPKVFTWKKSSFE